MISLTAPEVLARSSVYPSGGRIHDRLGSDICRGTWSVLDDKLLAESVGKPLANYTGDDVG